MALLPRVRWLLIFTVFALPLIFLPFIYLAFELPKIFLLYLCSTLMVFSLLLSGYRLGKLTKAHYLFLFFLAWICLMAILGLSPHQSFVGSYFRMQGIITWICYGILFFVSGRIFEENYARSHLCLAILAGSVVSAGLAIAQFVSLWFLGNTSQLLYSGRVISTFGQPNFLGAFLVMSLPFSWFLLKQVNKMGRVLIGFFMLVVVLGIFSTLSRSAYLGLASLALIWGFYHYRLLLAGIVISVLLFGFLATLFPQLVYSQWYRFQVDLVSKWTAENRLEILQKSFQLVSQKPLTGYGIENISLAFPLVITPDDLGLKDIVVDSSHNLFLDLSIELGLIGLGLYLSVVITLIFYGLQQFKSDNKEKKQFVKAALCVVIAFLVIHQFSVLSVVPMVLFWLCLGVLGGPALIQFTLQKKVKIFINFIGIILVGFMVFYVVRTIRAEEYFRLANAYEVADIKKAIYLDDEAIKLAPWIEFYSVRRNFLLKQLGY